MFSLKFVKHKISKYTEKILTFSSELKMFLKIDRNFKVENVFILLESSWIEYLFIYISSNKLLVQSVVNT